MSMYVCEWISDTSNTKYRLFVDTWLFSTLWLMKCDDSYVCDCNFKNLKISNLPYFFVFVLKFVVIMYCMRAYDVAGGRTS